MGAMMNAVERHGYPATTLREVVALAGVSNTAFYEQFSSLEECFLATHDEIIGLGIEQVMLAYNPESGLRERLHAAIEKYVDLALEHPAATHLAVVDSLSLGAVGVARRQKAIETWELLFRRSLEQEPHSMELSDLTVRAIVGGFHRVVYRRVREGRVEQLRSEIDALLDWGLSYQRPGGVGDWHLAAAGSLTPTIRARQEPEPDEGQIWSDGSAAIRSGSAPTQRERMVRAAALVVAKGGYGKLSIPAITSSAGVSNKTFYEHFSSAQEAFEEALDGMDRRALRRIEKAIGTQSTWPKAFVAGLDELLTVYSEDPALSRLPIIEALCAGSVGLDRIDRMHDRLVERFYPEEVLAELGNPVPEVVIEAIGWGIDAVIQHEVGQGRAGDLPELLDEVTYFALAPFGL